MPKLSYEQIRLLTWLTIVGDTFSIYYINDERRYCGLHQYVNPNGIEYKFDIRTLIKLLKTKLIKSQVVYHYGQKHKTYSLTEKGSAYSFLLCMSQGYSWEHLIKTS